MTFFLVFFSPLIRSSVTPKNKKSKKNDFKVFTCCHSCDWLAINFPTHKIPTFKSICISLHSRVLPKSKIEQKSKYFLFSSRQQFKNVTN